MRPMPPADKALVKLGQKLFFDPLLGGNKDVACATCHHPDFGSSDGRRLSIGTGGTGLGSDRRLGPGRRLTARHSPDLFERARPEWRVLFWDGRLQKGEDKQWRALSPQAVRIPLPSPRRTGASPLATTVQSWLPPLARVEMRGQVQHAPAGLIADRAWDGSENELAAMGNDDLVGVWRALRQRILAIPAYRQAFTELSQQNDPSPAAENLADVAGFMQLAGMAISAFMQEAFRADKTPWDRFLAGDDTVLSQAQMRGALLFYGDAGCARCHRGALFSDQKFHHIGVVPYAAALIPGSQQDLGRFLISRRVADRYAFRTPPLRNVALTAPYFHNGSVATLQDAIWQHVSPRQQWTRFNWQGLPWEIRSISHPELVNREKFLQTLAPALSSAQGLSQAQVDDLQAFLNALTDPRGREIRAWIPASVPSGLPVPRLD